MRFIIKGSTTKEDLIRKVTEAPYMTAKKLAIAITALKENRYEVDKTPGIVVEESQYKNAKHKEMGLSELIIKLTKQEIKKLQNEIKDKKALSGKDTEVEV